MDSPTKSAIKSLVLDLRHTLEDELTLALKRYGIFTDQKWTPDAPPDRLTDAAEREAWQRIVTVIRRSLKEGRTLPQASADYVREAAFTLLNRLVGLKCLEVRGIIPEIITTRDIYSERSQAHRDYRDAHPREARAADDALPAALIDACRRVNADLIGYLFDPDDDFSLIWPRYAVLKGCIEKINALDEAVWREDEIIGWLYQFYNAEEKVAVRRRGKPQTPHDVAVINQFFTPRWVVKFLVDNTLGRLWLEMHPDSARVREKCDYLVPEVRSTEYGVGSKGQEAGGKTQEARSSESANRRIGESANQRIGEPPHPQPTTHNPQLDPDSPLNNPAAPARRPTKPVTDIRLLDPACGTMHFGHYACEVFAEMYRDSLEHGWSIEGSKRQEAGSENSASCILHPASSITVNDSEIPTLILQHNLFGVDIDRRAVQLAALSLFMKARTLHPEAQVRQVNLVSADATLPDSGVKQKFLARYKDAPPVQRAFAQVLADMDHVAQVGSLLRVEERLRALLTEAGYALSETGEIRLRSQRAIPGLEAPVRQLELGEQPNAGSGWTPGYTLAGLRDDLRAFARDALQEHDLNAQLFAAEADKAVRLLDVLMGEYDVVVMNPPYGGTTEEAKKHLGKSFSSTKNDLYAAFFERAGEFLNSGGFVGALTSRTFLNLMTFKELREKILLEQTPPVAALDLGFGILDDAMVETVAMVLQKTDQKKLIREAIFFRLNSFGEQRQTNFELALQSLPSEDINKTVFVVQLDNFKLVPGTPFAYWVSESLQRLFSKLPSLQPEYAWVKQGLATADDSRFVRQWWEISSRNIGKGQKWVSFSKGGEYSKYYSDLHLVLNWDNNGTAIKSFSRAVVRNESYYYREGLTWPLVTIKGLNVRRLPSGAIFGHKGPAILPKIQNIELLWFGLGLLNSILIQAFLFVLTPSRSFEVGHISNLPFVQSDGKQRQHIAQLARNAYDFKSAWDTGNELCTRFTAPWLLQIAKQVAGNKEQGAERQEQGTGLEQVLALLGDDAPALPATSAPLLPATPATLLLAPLLSSARAIENAADARLQALQAEIDNAVYDLYEISPADRALIERELGDRPPEVVWPQLEGKSDAEKRREHVRRLFSYYALRAARASEDGIVPLAGCAARAPYLVERVRTLLEAEFGAEAAYQLEQDAAAYLGRPLEDWLHVAFFRDFHVKLYKNRPILWQVASARRAFAVLLDYHRLTRDTLPKVRSHYLWPQMESVRTRLAAVKAHEGSLKEIGDLEAELADLEDCDRRLESVIQGTVEVTLPEWAVGPYRKGQPPYNPDLDDGVAVNIAPVQAAGVLGGKVK